MTHYKSWSGLNKQLHDMLCDELRDRITYFLTRYHEVHNAYGRASVRLDGRELVCFHWMNMYRQESDIHNEWPRTGRYDPWDPALKDHWDADGTYCEWDFLNAALTYLQTPIRDALASDDSLIRLFAILDRRVGKRTLRTIAAEKAFMDYPDWVKQFYLLRLETSGIERTG